ncbi:hypothetical protein QA648_34740 (plasmid) [Rhizobium sp. CB3171]|uniref:hypothetical protein n=1 Tax=Rhizobium sp. CB3171 TaxID=3039157 RepID=UPI0024B03D47|nr:hypothetical protein [Rhizobium sp. CB3171]WFU07243.1 hypothetical protein QA648_34740 [Rhizobium sp. CB3171]
MNRQSDSDAGRVFIGYARVSTRGQDLDQERAALGAAGCVRLLGSEQEQFKIVRGLYQPKTVKSL